ncbi:MAG: RNA polymerase sigma factor [Fimbriimonadaceae bacterium]|nr:RNA polymerase sigma factor [Armatimonadota bacterium]
MNYEKLVEEHKDAVYRQMVRVCGNHDDAEDVLVEALIRAYKAMEQLEDEGAFRNWLTTIGKRVCIRLRHKEKLQPIMALAEVSDQADPNSPEPKFGMEELKSQLQTALDSMPEEMRTVYELRELEGLSGDETAERLDISLAAMKSRLHRARQHVREQLDHCVECQDAV